MDDPAFFLPAAAAARSGVPELQIHAAIARGQLRTVLYRGEVRIPADVLTRFLDTAGAAPASAARRDDAVQGDETALPHAV